MQFGKETTGGILASFSRTMCPATKQKGFRNEFEEVSTWPPSSPDLNQVEHVWDVLEADAMD